MPELHQLMSAVNNQAEGPPLAPLLFLHLLSKLSGMIVLGVKRHCRPCAPLYIHPRLLDFGKHREKYNHSGVILGVFQDGFSHLC